MATAAETYPPSFWSGLRPDPRLSVSEWADRNRTMPAKGTAHPGPWRTSRTPYLREIMECLSPSSPVEWVVFMKGARIGATEAGNNWIGYVIDQAPGPMLVCLPSLVLAQRFSRQSIKPLVEETKCLQGKVREPRSRDSGNTTLMKEFPGGLLTLVGANSAASLRGMAARYLMLDDVDGFPGDAEGEGDPAELARNRTRNFSNRKIFENSTPTFTGRSRIENDFADTDQRYYHVPCPACGNRAPIKWADLRWEKGKPETAKLACTKCGVLIEEHHKTTMLEQGEWVPSREGKDPRIRGYHLSALYSPLGMYSWREVVTDWERAEGHPDRLRNFVNTVLGETWREKGEAPDWQRLHDRREEYKIGTVPAGGVVLTAGVDVQHDRLEVEIVAWGPGMESWSIEHVAYPGDTAQEETWWRLDELLARSWPHEGGANLPIRMLAVDAGDRQSVTCAWTRRKPLDRVIAVKGSDTRAAIISAPTIVDVTLRGRKLTRGARLWPVGVGLVKSELYGWLRMQRPEDPARGLPPGWCHFPMHPEEYFKQLTAEELVTRIVRGYRHTAWEKLANRRNEVLDCRVYARAAAALLGLDRWDEARWLAHAASLGVALSPRPVQDPARPPAASPPSGAAAAPPRSKRRGGFLDRWRRD